MSETDEKSFEQALEPLMRESSKAAQALAAMVSAADAEMFLYRHNAFLASCCKESPIARRAWTIALVDAVPASPLGIGMALVAARDAFYRFSFGSTFHREAEGAIVVLAPRAMLQAVNEEGASADRFLMRHEVFIKHCRPNDSAASEDWRRAFRAACDSFGRVCAFEMASKALGKVLRQTPLGETIGAMAAPFALGEMERAIGKQAREDFSLSHGAFWSFCPVNGCAIADAAIALLVGPAMEAFGVPHILERAQEAHAVLDRRAMDYRDGFLCSTRQTLSLFVDQAGMGASARPQPVL